MPTVDFKPIANSGSTLAESQAAWVSDLAGPLANGFPSGIVTSGRLNKALRQSSMIAAALANFVSTTNNADLLDDGNLTNLIAALTSALGSASVTAGVSPGEGHGVIKLFGGALIVQFGYATASATADTTVTYPQPFPNRVFAVFCCSQYTNGTGQVYTMVPSAAPTLSNFVVRGSASCAGNWLAFGN